MRVLKFNSKSVFMKKTGNTYRVPINNPSSFKNYVFADWVFVQAVEEFNKKLYERSNMTLNIGNIRVDVLELIASVKDAMVVWLVVQEKDVDAIKAVPFTIKGDVYFDGDSDVNVDKMVIGDLMFSDAEGIFTRN